MCKADNVSKTSTITFWKSFVDWDDDLDESSCEPSPDKERMDNTLMKSRLPGVAFILRSTTSQIPNDDDENSGQIYCHVDEGQRG